jgi:hypothetical protein
LPYVGHIYIAGAVYRYPVRMAEACSADGYRGTAARQGSLYEVIAIIAHIYIP